MLDDRAAAAGDDGVVIGAPPSRVEARVIAHDAKTLRVEPLEDTMLAAYLIEPGRAEYLLDDLAAEYGVEVIPDPVVDEETTALVKAAETPRRLAPLMVARLRERDVERLYRNVELPLTRVLAAMEDAGVKIDTYRMGEITARLADRLEELESRSVRARGRGVHDRLDAAGRARSSSRSSALTPGRKGKTGYSTDTRVLRSIRHEHEIVERDRGVARVLEAAEHVPRPAAVAARRRTAGCTRRSTRPSRRPAASRRRTRTCRRSRSAPTSAARSAARSSPSRDTA